MAFPDAGRLLRQRLCLCVRFCGQVHPCSCNFGWGGSLFFSPLVASGLVWVAGIPVGLLLSLPRSRLRAVDFFAGFGLLLSGILGLLWGCSLGFFLPLGAGFLLDQVLGDDGRFTPLKTCLAASNCWRSRRFTWPGSPWRCSSSPTPADQEAQWQMGGSKDPGAFPSNSKFCRVLCVSRCPWSLCGAGCVVFFPSLGALM